jgi:hypothetical protein
MKNKIYIGLFLVFAGIVVVNAQECVTCYKSNGTPVNVGAPSWNESRNGISYTCTCTSSGPRCSSTSSGGGGYSSGNSTQEIMTSVVGNLFQNLLNSIFNSSDESTSGTQSSSSGSASTYQMSQEDIDAAIASQKAWKAQVDKLQGDYNKVLNEKFADQQKNAANDLKNRFVRSEATKAIKQLNCAARKHIGDARLVLNGSASLKDIDTPLGDLRSSADFTGQPEVDCQPIEVKIPEVTVQNPVGFQQMMYQTIQLKADSISVVAASLRGQKNNLKKTIDEKKSELEKLSAQNDEDLKKKAREALAAAQELEQQVDVEIDKNQKGLDALEKIRSTYDIKEQKK